MNLLPKLSLICISAATYAFAADIPKNVLPDNVVLCQPNSGCTNKTLFGRTYKVLTTPRFTVMVSVSQEGDYTRADVSIANNTGYQINLSPDDFRVEVVSPKPRVLLYIPPAELHDVPASPPIPPVPQAEAAPAPQPATTQPETPATEAASQPASADQPTAANIDELYAAAKKREIQQEAADKAAALQHLSAASLPPNVVTRGRVYFERDKRAQLVTVVLPIAGVVFEFPYAMKH